MEGKIDRGNDGEEGIDILGGRCGPRVSASSMRSKLTGNPPSKVRNIAAQSIRPSSVLTRETEENANSEGRKEGRGTYKRINGGSLISSAQRSAGHRENGGVHPFARV